MPLLRFCSALPMSNMLRRSFLLCSVHAHGLKRHLCLGMFGVVQCAEQPSITSSTCAVLLSTSHFPPAPPPLQLVGRPIAS